MAYRPSLWNRNDFYPYDTGNGNIKYSDKCICTIIYYLVFGKSFD